MQLQINLNAVKMLALEMGITSLKVLAIEAGIGANKFYKKGGFNSTTVDKVAEFLECDPMEILHSVDTGRS